MNTLLLLLMLSTLQGDRPVGGGCESCELIFVAMPDKLSSQTRLTPDGESGTPLLIEGTIYKKDGKTPASGVILYVYHTDAKGEYSKSSEPGGATRHGHIRGWIKTGEDGKYRFTSIRPGAYPGRQAPEHIHPLIKEPGLSVYWIDEYLFDDDPLLTEKEKSNQKLRGGPGVIHLTKTNGVWRGQRDIILGMNIPGY